MTIEVSPEEIIQLARTAPDAVYAFFDTLDRFRERITARSEAKEKREERHCAAL